MARANRRYTDSLAGNAKVMSKGFVKHSLFIISLVLIRLISILQKGFDNSRVTAPGPAQQMILPLALTLRGPSGGHCVELMGGAKMDDARHTLEARRAPSVSS